MDTDLMQPQSRYVVRQATMFKSPARDVSCDGDAPRDVAANDRDKGVASIAPVRLGLRASGSSSVGLDEEADARSLTAADTGPGFCQAVPLPNEGEAVGVVWHSKRHRMEKSSIDSALHDSACRLFDIIMASLAIAAFLPLFILIVCIIRASRSGPALFVQPRVGRDGKLFPCLKFRSMVSNAQEELERHLKACPEAMLEWERDQKLRDDPRVTFIGTLLRRSSLDELPQLFNILLGHMSVVGPRPIVASEIERYGDRITAYCSVRPGLTGLWQVSGRNDVSYEARVRLDAFYALRKSLAYDVSICLRTVPAVLGSRGCY